MAVAGMLLFVFSGRALPVRRTWACPGLLVVGVVLLRSVLAAHAEQERRFEDVRDAPEVRCCQRAVEHGVVLAGHLPAAVGKRAHSKDSAAALRPLGLRHRGRAVFTAC